jgi:hypothetical protein
VTDRLFDGLIDHLRRIFVSTKIIADENGFIQRRRARPSTVEIYSDGIARTIEEAAYLRHFGEELACVAR